MNAGVVELVEALVEALSDKKQLIVLAESCTGGMVACELAKIAGVSSVFCGSAVTYRDDTKQRWLGVDSETIQQLSSVSAPVAHQMARGALTQTPEADIAVSITGHLGPAAPDGFDGIVFIGLAKKVKGKTQVTVTQHDLTHPGRGERQVEATELVLSTALESV